MNKWAHEYNPLRKIILLGYLDDFIPSRLIFYARHKFEGRQGQEYILSDNVTYTSFAIFKGNKKQLPSFKAVRIVNDDTYSRRRKEEIKMYLKKGAKYNWYWDLDDDYLYENFYTLNDDLQFKIPYFKDISYEEYTKIINDLNILPHNFKLIQNPNDLFKLNQDQMIYYDYLLKLTLDSSLYNRKKALSELISKNPPKDLYLKLLDFGSYELISGLFLDLAKLNNNILLEEAKNILKENIDCTSDNCKKGLKRCIEIYINSLEEKFKEKRIKFIYENFNKMELHLKLLNNKDLVEDKNVLDSSIYKRQCERGYLAEYRYSWNYDEIEKRYKRIKHKAKERYDKTLYCDGINLNIVELKNTLQEAIIYDLYAVIGKIAYYIDSPRLVYYLRGSQNFKALNYFIRLLKRTINDYAKNTPIKFMEIMKVLLTSYKDYDYLSKYKNDFRFNKFIRYYLYNDLESDFINCNHYDNNYKLIDPLLKAHGRYEYQKNIWSNNIDYVVDIALESKLEQIQKACYHILIDLDDINSLIDSLDFKKIMDLADSNYEPLSNLFISHLKIYIDSKDFDSNILLNLISSNKTELVNLGIAYFENSNAKLNYKDIANLLFLENIDCAKLLLSKSLKKLNNENYINFIDYILSNLNNFNNIEFLFDDIKTVLNTSSSIILDFSILEKKNLFDKIIYTLLNDSNINTWIRAYLNHLIFSINYTDLKEILNNTNIEITNKITAKNMQIISIFDSIKNNNIPKDYQIINLLENGNSAMIKILVDIIETNKILLNNRLETILILFESDVLALNIIAKSVFENIDKSNKIKLHKLILDSPFEKVNSYAISKLKEEYNDYIPREFIIQMLEHPNTSIKAYISDKLEQILNDLSSLNKDIFVYYINTLLLMPNKLSKSKDFIYNILPEFINNNKDKQDEIENLLFNIGCSNIIVDSERALVALAKIKKEVC
ncbi:hypothetical protein WG909_12335 [Peptostreptococcaceae bacterium AGR-M142]